MAQLTTRAYERHQQNECVTSIAWRTTYAHNNWNIYSWKVNCPGITKSYYMISLLWPSVVDSPQMATLFKSPDQPLLPGKPVTPLETRIYLAGRFFNSLVFFVTRANVILYSVVLQRKRLICDWKKEALLSVLQLRLIVIRRKKKPRLQVNMNPKANPG